MHCPTALAFQAFLEVDERPACRGAGTAGRARTHPPRRGTLQFPEWLNVVAAVFLAVSLTSAIVVIADVLLAGHRQAMWIMDVVWPVTALWAGPFGLYAYFRWGRAGERSKVMEAKQHGEEPPSKRQPFAVLTGKGATHCGSGCTLGDVVAELLILVVPLSLFGKKIFGAWVYDYVLAFSLGIAFQYFTIKPMRQLSVKEGLKAAVKADALSLTAWQVGMYGWMAIATFAIFGHEIGKGTVVFWFMMQIAMFCGFATSYPVNWWLLKHGVKGTM